MSACVYAASGEIGLTSSIKYCEKKCRRTKTDESEEEALILDEKASQSLLISIQHPLQIHASAISVFPLSCHDQCTQHFLVRWDVRTHVQVPGSKKGTDTF